MNKKVLLVICLVLLVGVLLMLGCSKKEPAPTPEPPPATTSPEVMETPETPAETPVASPEETGSPAETPAETPVTTETPGETPATTGTPPIETSTKSPGPGTGKDLTPKEVFEAFTKAVVDGRTEEAWSFLSKESQGEVKKEDFMKTFGEMPKDPATLKEIQSTKVLDEKVDGDKAELTIETTDAAGKATTDKHEMIKEEGLWKMLMK